MMASLQTDKTAVHLATVVVAVLVVSCAPQSRGVYADVFGQAAGQATHDVVAGTAQPPDAVTQPAAPAGSTVYPAAPVGGSVNSVAPVPYQSGQVYDAYGNPVAPQPSVYDSYGNPVAPQPSVYDSYGNPVAPQPSVYDAYGNPVPLQPSAYDAYGNPVVPQPSVYDAYGNPVAPQPTYETSPPAARLAPAAGAPVAPAPGVRPISPALLSTTISALEVGMNRAGQDYTHFPIDAERPERCRDACNQDSRCRAFTYVKPNCGQGPKAQCWLKGAAPPARSDPCCVSGVKP